MRPTIKDENRDLVEEAAAEYGSKTAAVNHAVKQSLGGDEASNEKVNSHLRPELRKAHRILWDASIDGKLKMDAGLAVVAQKMQVSKDICKQMYVKPLKSEDMVRVENSWTEITIYVRDPDTTVTTNTESHNHDPRDDIDDPEAADGRLDQLATDGGSKA